MTPATVTDPNVAVARAFKYANHGRYMLGTGDSDYAGKDSDCAGYAICYAWGLRRHQPGFNVGSWATVSDDINTDSCIEDAEHLKELFEFATYPERGDLLVYKTIHLPAHPKPWIGHVGIITNVPKGWTPGKGQYHRLDVIQCRGPNRATPGIVCTDGSVWDRHDDIWGHDDHGAPVPTRLTKVIRVKR